MSSSSLLWLRVSAVGALAWFGILAPSALLAAEPQFEIETVAEGRLRTMLRTLADVNATKRGFALAPRHAPEVVVLARPVEEEHAAVLAFLADGESWSSSALALAHGASHRRMQQALD